MRPLTPYEQEVLAYLDNLSDVEKHGDGPWQRAYVGGRTAIESAAMGRLARLGLIERRYGRPAAKLGHQYRSFKPVREPYEVL